MILISQICLNVNLVRFFGLLYLVNKILENINGFGAFHTIKIGLLMRVSILFYGFSGKLLLSV